jgi:hypothetical protein
VRTMRSSWNTPSSGNYRAVKDRYGEPERGECLRLKVVSKFVCDSQADKSPVVVKGPFFPRVVNPRYRIRGTMCNARIQSSKAR